MRWRGSLIRTSLRSCNLEVRLIIIIIIIIIIIVSITIIIIIISSSSIGIHIIDINVINKLIRLF